MFDEKKGWNWEESGDWEDGGMGALSSSFTIEHLVYREAKEVEGEGDLGAMAGAEELATPVAQGSPAPGTSAGQASPAAAPAMASPSTASPVRFTLPPLEVSDLVDDDYEGEPL